jgi:hypothetical protein
VTNLNRLDKAMTTEQFTQIVDAILDGKYSWACVLILRFAGYNPLHYIPYRTYNRLMKENPQLNSHSHPKPPDFLEENQPVQVVSDLSFLETLKEDCSQIHGGRKVDSAPEESWKFLIKIPFK